MKFQKFPTVKDTLYLGENSKFSNRVCHKELNLIQASNQPSVCQPECTPFFFMKPAETRRKGSFLVGLFFGLLLCSTLVSLYFFRLPDDVSSLPNQKSFVLSLDSLKKEDRNIVPLMQRPLQPPIDTEKEALLKLKVTDHAHVFYYPWYG